MIKNDGGYHQGNYMANAMGISTGMGWTEGFSQVIRDIIPFETWKVQCFAGMVEAK